MNALLRRLGSAERWWAAEAILRSTGVALLAGCAFALLSLYRSEQAPPLHEASVRELFQALAAVLSWCLGWLLLVVGQGLFTRVPRPGGFHLMDFPVDGASDDRPDVAGDAGGPRAADVRLPAPVRESLRLAA